MMELYIYSRGYNLSEKWSLGGNGICSTTDAAIRKIQIQVSLIPELIIYYYHQWQKKPLL